MSNIEKKEPSKNRAAIFIVLGCGGVLTICVLFFAFFISRNAVEYIAPDQRGVVISATEPKGYHSEPLKPGWHWITPFVENVKVYSIAPQTYVMSAQSSVGDDSIKAVTRDGQSVNVSVSVVYALDPNKIIELHITWQDRYEEKLVRPLARSITRDILLQYYTVELSGKRAWIEQAISDQLSQKFAENDLMLIHFIVDDIRIP